MRCLICGPECLNPSNHAAVRPPVLARVGVRTGPIPFETFKAFFAAMPTSPDGPWVIERVDEITILEGPVALIQDTERLAGAMGIETVTP